MRNYGICVDAGGESRKKPEDKNELFPQGMSMITAEMGWN
jgi:hypothetical protein